MGDFHSKHRKICKSNKTPAKQQFSTSNTNYQKSICSDKYVNGKTPSNGKTGGSLLRKRQNTTATDIKGLFSYARQ